MICLGASTMHALHQTYSVYLGFGWISLHPYPILYLCLDPESVTDSVRFEFVTYIIGYEYDRICIEIPKLFFTLGLTLSDFRPVQSQTDQSR